MQKPGSVDKEFIDLVARDVRGLLREDERQQLHTPENLDRMYDALNALKKDVEVQLSNQKSRWVKKRHELNETGDDGTEWVAYKASEADWRARAIKFLMAVEDHLSAAKAQIKRRNIVDNGGDVTDLLDSIFEHQEEISADEASLADKRLWERAASFKEGSA